MAHPILKSTGYGSGIARAPMLLGRRIARARGGSGDPLIPNDTTRVRHEYILPFIFLGGRRRTGAIHS